MADLTISTLDVLGEPTPAVKVIVEPTDENGARMAVYQNGAPVVATARGETNTDGELVLDLVPQASLSPDPSYYTVWIGTQSWLIVKGAAEESLLEAMIGEPTPAGSALTLSKLQDVDPTGAAAGKALAYDTDGVTVVPLTIPTVADVTGKVDADGGTLVSNLDADSNTIANLAPPTGDLNPVRRAEGGIIEWWDYPDGAVPTWSQGYTLNPLWWDELEILNGTIVNPDPDDGAIAQQNNSGARACLYRNMPWSADGVRAHVELAGAHADVGHGAPIFCIDTADDDFGIGIFYEDGLNTWVTWLIGRRPDQISSIDSAAGGELDVRSYDVEVVDNVITAYHEGVAVLSTPIPVNLQGNTTHGVLTDINEVSGRPANTQVFKGPVVFAPASHDTASIDYVDRRAAQKATEAVEPVAVLAGGAAPKAGGEELTGVWEWNDGTGGKLVISKGAADWHLAFYEADSDTVPALLISSSEGFGPGIAFGAGGSSAFDAIITRPSAANLAITGTVTATMLATGGDASSANQVPRLSQVQAMIAAIVDSAPAALDTLNELAAALGDDAAFSTTVTNALAGKVNDTGDTITGVLTIDHAGTDPGKIATLSTAAGHGIGAYNAAADAQPAAFLSAGLFGGAISLGAGGASTPDVPISRVAAGIVAVPCLDLARQTAPGTPGSNRARIYIEDAGGGKERAVIKWDDGSTSTIATQP